MKFRGVLLKPLDRQGDRDDLFIDPNGVKFDAEAWYPISPNFDHSAVPIGRGRVRREEDGTLIVEGELFSVPGTVFEKKDPPLKLAIGVIADMIETPGTLRESKMMPMIGITGEHKDPTQPPIELEVQMNIVRDGHYHIPSGPGEKGDCRAAKVVAVIEQDPIRAIVNLTVWDHDGDQMPHLGVKQDDPLQGTERGEATFHLAMECPWGR